MDHFFILGYKIEHGRSEIVMFHFRAVSFFHEVKKATILSLQKEQKRKAKKVVFVVAQMTKKPRESRR